MSHKCIVEFGAYGDINEFEITKNMTEGDIIATVWEYGKEFLSTIISWRIEKEDDE